MPAREAELRRLLRRFPYWAEGHRQLAELALLGDAVALAYSSAISYEILNRDAPTHRGQALLLLGRCFLKRGDWRRALAHFSQAQSLGFNTPKLAEEMAAAHILAGAYPEALFVLNSIPDHSLSAEAKAALSFVRGKGAA